MPIRIDTESLLSAHHNPGKIILKSLENATARMVHLEHEIAFLHNYLRLEQMRFPDKFDFTNSCFDREATGFVLLPPLLVQPFAENAIRHGFMHLRKKGDLSIVFESAANEVLKCTITDNGIGRGIAPSKEVLPPDNDRPHSGTITATRTRLFNTPGLPEIYKIVYTGLWKDGEPCGLKVELYMPMETGRGSVF